MVWVRWHRHSCLCLLSGTGRNACATGLWLLQPAKRGHLCHGRYYISTVWFTARVSSGGALMDLLGQVVEGFKGIDADAGLKGQALKYLRQWLTEP